MGRCMGQVRWKVSDFAVKKEPKQARSRASVDAMVQACARVLESRGYAGLSTNAIAEVAGVSIGSVYEYFPGKDASVARLAEGMLRDVTTLLQGRLAPSVEDVVDMARPVLTHRMALNFAARARGESLADLIDSTAARILRGQVAA